MIDSWSLTQPLESYFRKSNLPTIIFQVASCYFSEECKLWWYDSTNGRVLYQPKLEFYPQISNKLLSVGVIYEKEHIKPYKTHINPYVSPK